MRPGSQLVIGQLLHSALANAPDQEIVHADVARYTYRDLPGRLGRLAGALKELGVSEGDVVAVMDWDSHRYYEAFFAVPMMGATLHTINIRLSPEQILYTINHAQDDVILVHEDFAPVLAGIAERINRPMKFVLMQDVPGALPDGVDISGEYEALLDAANADFEFPDLDENTRATLFYTTGTTGDPKGVSFSHRQIVLHTLGFVATIGPVPGYGGFHRSDVYMPITPLFHVHAWGFPYAATMLGVKQIYPGRYEPAKLLGLIEAHGVTFSHCVPTILAMLLNAPGSEAVDLSRWKVLIGGSALTRGMTEQALARDIDIHAAYGMSETCPLLSVADMTGSPDADDSIAVRKATGKSAPLVQLALRAEDGTFLPHDGEASGEIVARAPWLTEGYLHNEDASDALWAEGWLHTGDVGSIDTDGTLRIGDRLKDVIKSGGEWISSLDLENIASQIDGVAEVAAIGLPDERWGERPCLAVALDSGIDHDTALAGISDAIGKAIEVGRLSKWANPDRVAILDILPKTSVGKLDKKVLRKSLTLD